MLAVFSKAGLFELKTISSEDRPIITALYLQSLNLLLLYMPTCLEGKRQGKISVSASYYVITNHNNLNQQNGDLYT